MCRDHAQYPAFAPGSSEVAVGFLAFLYLGPCLPQLRMCIVISSPLHIVSGFSVAGGDICPGAKASAKGPRSQTVLSVPLQVHNAESRGPGGGRNPGGLDDRCLVAT